ncbi:MAG TPA: NAD(P)H-dependent oxidoreductase [Candidatus Acidoferrales bacterium]|nr:NAD(P)H-dependent oxidoreductase [Candidatus Acidoferrales bacterium]
MRILGVSGSIRKRSFNTALLEEAKSLLPENCPLEIADLSSMPLYSQDLEAALPESVRVFKEKIQNADAILFATTEHNFSITAVLKNAIEWGGRPADDNSWDGKPAAIISASTSPRGGVRAQLHLRQILVDLNIHALNEPALILGNAELSFDANVRLTDERARNSLKAVLEALVAWSAKIQAH